MFTRLGGDLPGEWRFGLFLRRNGMLEILGLAELSDGISNFSKLRVCSNAHRLLSVVDCDFFFRRRSATQDA